MRGWFTERICRSTPLALWVVATVVAGCGPTETTPGTGMPTTPVKTVFPDLGSAATAGMIDPELVTDLQAGKSIDALAILEGAAMLAAYGNGDPSGVTQAAATLSGIKQQVMGATTATVLRQYDLVPVLFVRLATPAETLKLLNLSQVKSLRADLELDHQLAMSLPVIEQPRVAARGLTGRGVGIAVLDTGADYVNSELGHCLLPGEPHCRVAEEFDVAPSDGSLDDNGHGTNVSAIASAVAPDALLYVLDVFEGRHSRTNLLLAGLDWVLANARAKNIRAVNLSVGHTYYYTNGCAGRDPADDVVLALRNAGAVPVIAAGNTATPNGGAFRDGIEWPACVPGALPVGATYSASFGDVAFPLPDACEDMTTAADQVACFSQDAPNVLLAPGAYITAAGLKMAGTSQAAPHVSGAIAVLAQARPDATADELETFVRTSSTVVTDPRSGRTHPRLDLFNALGAAVPIPNDNRLNATVLPRWGGALTQNTWAATKEPAEPDHAGEVGGASVWFKWTATSPGQASFSTNGSDYNTLLAAYHVDAGGNLIALASSNDVPGLVTSFIQLPVTQNDEIWIAVDGLSTFGFPQTGTLHLTWNLPNDNVDDALEIAAGTTMGANIGATHEPRESHCSDTFASASVWYRFTPTTASTAHLTASGSAFLCVEVFEWPSNAVLPLDAPPLQSGDNDGPLPIDFTFPVSPGQTYWIAVDGVSLEMNCDPLTGRCFYTTPTGTFTLELTL